MLDKSQDREKDKDKEKEKLRPFTVSHQKVVLDIEFASRTILASTELQIQLNTVDIPFLRLHSKRCDIESVWVNETPVKFEIFDPCLQLCTSEELNTKSDCDYTMFQKLFDYAKHTSELGELAIEIPKGLKLEEFLAPDCAGKNAEKDIKEPVSETAEPNNGTPTTKMLVIKIDYSVSQPELGLMFSANCRVEDETASSYLYTTNQLGPGDARCWVPSLDEAHEKCTWELDFIVSQGSERKLKEPGFSVVASGVQIRQDLSAEDPNRSFFRYFVPFTCPAYLLSFAIGKFDSTMLTELENYTETSAPENGDGDSNKKVTAYSPVGWSDELRVTCQTVVKVMEFYLNEFGSYPLDSVKLVFLQTSSAPLFIGAEVIILSLEFLHPEEVIDQTYESRRVIALALASQWFGVGIVPKSSPDIWLVLGLSGFMTSLFLKTHLGRNEYRYRMKQDMLKIVNLDTSRPPLFNPKLTCPFDAEDIDFIRLKATFVLYMLDKQMMKGAASAGLHRLMPKVLVSAMCGELAMGNTLSTAWFLRTCRKMSGVELKGFSEQWIYYSGCPSFHFTYSFNRKKMVVEITAQQSHTNSGIMNDSSVDLDFIKPARYFSGHMTASIREPDGTPYEHVLEIQEDANKFEVQFNTKYKRIRRNTKRFQKRKAEAAAAEAIVKDQLDGDNAAHDDLFLAEEGKEKEKEDWRIVEWGEADEESLESATFEWIRLDSDFEWICQIELQQPDYMWAGQLEKDRDVVSQFEAVEALKRFPSQATSTTLLRTVMNSQCFYRIRADAAMALVHCDRAEFGNIGRHHLLRIFHKKYCADDALDERQPELFVPRPLDFSNLAEYFVQKAVILAISLLSDSQAEPVSHRLLLNLLKSNDNSNNAYSDCYFLGALITALGNALANTKTLLSSGQLLIDELKRYATMDCLIPSYHNVVTVSCLQTYTRLFLAKLLSPDLPLLMRHSRYGNFLHVRMAAFDGLLLLDGLLTSAVRTYLLSTIELDPDHHVRLYVATNLARICAIYLGKQAELSARPPRWAQFQDCPTVRATLHRMLLNPHLDPRLRRTLNVLCSLLYPSPACSLNLNAFQIKINEVVPARSKPLLALPPADLPNPSPATVVVLPAQMKTSLPHKIPSKPPTPRLITPPQPAHPPANPGMPDEDMVTAKRLMRRLAGFDGESKLFVDRNKTWNLPVINSRLTKLQYESLEALGDDIAEMLAYYKKHYRKDSEATLKVNEMEAYYNDQLRKLQETQPPPIAPPLKSKKVRSPEPKKESVKLIFSVDPSRPLVAHSLPAPFEETAYRLLSHPSVVQPLSPSSEESTYRGFPSREQYDQAKQILTEILAMPEAAEYLNILDENSTNKGLKVARRKLKCGSYNSPDDMYSDIMSTLLSMIKMNARDSVTYRQGKTLRKSFDAMWRDSFPDASLAQDSVSRSQPIKIRSKVKAPEDMAQEEEPPAHFFEDGNLERKKHKEARNYSPSRDFKLDDKPRRSKHKPRSISPFEAYPPDTRGLPPRDLEYDSRRGRKYPGDFSDPPNYHRNRDSYAQQHHRHDEDSPIPRVPSPVRPPKKVFMDAKHRRKHDRDSISKEARLKHSTGHPPHAHFSEVEDLDPYPTYPRSQREDRRSHSPPERAYRSPLRSMEIQASKSKRKHKHSTTFAPSHVDDYVNESGDMDAAPMRERPIKKQSASRPSLDGLLEEYQTPPSHHESERHKYRDPPSPQEYEERGRQHRYPEVRHKHASEAIPLEEGSRKSSKPGSGKRDETRIENSHKFAVPDESKHRSRNRSPSHRSGRPLLESPRITSSSYSKPAMSPDIAQFSKQRSKPIPPTEPLPIPEFDDDIPISPKRDHREGFSVRKVKLTLNPNSPKRSVSPQDDRSLKRKHSKRSPSPKRPSKYKMQLPDPMEPNVKHPSNKRSYSSQEEAVKKRHKSKSLSNPNDMLYPYINNILKELDNHPCSSPFRQPVDPISLQIPTYFDIIKHPMDLSTLRTRVEKRSYTCFNEFDRDARLITDNACLFNQLGTWVNDEAQLLRNHYDDVVSKFDGYFLDLNEKQSFLELLELLSHGNYARTFMPPTQFCQYMSDPVDLDRLRTLLNTNHFYHIGEVEKAFKSMLVTAYNFFPPGSPEYKDTLRLEKHYVNHFEHIYKRPSSFMGEISRQKPCPLMTNDKKSLCSLLLKKLIAMKSAVYFTSPVDYVKLKLPHYPIIIRQPMDLGTMRTKLNSGAYCTLAQFERDIDLIVRNCCNFNGVESPFSIEARKVEAAFRKEWVEILPTNSSSLLPSMGIKDLPSPAKLKARSQTITTKLPQTTVQLLKSALHDLKLHPHYSIFGRPVDPALVPQYPQFIKNPMDFGTIQTKLKSGAYLTVEAFLEDANLVFSNCFTFNFPTDPVYLAGQDLLKTFESIWIDKGLNLLVDVGVKVGGNIKEDHYSDEEEEISIISPKVKSRPTEKSKFKSSSSSGRRH